MRWPFGAGIEFGVPTGKMNEAPGLSFKPPLVEQADGSRDETDSAAFAVARHL